MTQEQVPEAVERAPSEAENSSWPAQRIVFAAAGGLGGIILLIFVIGLILALTDQFEMTALRVQYFRDLFVIVMLIEGILIIGGLATLIVQVTRLIRVIQQETTPIVKDAQEAVSSARGTVDFVGDNVTRPIVQTGAFMSGAWVFVREWGGLRRAIRRTAKADKQDE